MFRRRKYPRTAVSVERASSVGTTIDGQAYLVTFDRSLLHGRFVDGTAWVVHESGAEIIAISPAPTQRTVEIHTALVSTAGVGPWWVDGNMLNPGLRSQANQLADKQAFDERCTSGTWGSTFDASYKISIPYEMVVGDRLVLSKSLDSIYGGPGTISNTPLHSMWVVTVLDAVPPGFCYRPPLNTSRAILPLILQVPQTALPYLDQTDAQTLMNGDVVTETWAQAWNLPQYDNGRYVPGLAFAQTISTSYYELFGTKQYSEVQTSGGRAYSWGYTLNRRILRARIAGENSDAERQTIVDDYCQWLIDYWGQLASRTDWTGDQEDVIMSAASGGHCVGKQEGIPMAGYLLSKSASPMGTTIASEMLPMCEDDAATINGGVVVPHSSHLISHSARQITEDRLDELTVFHNRLFDLDAATDTSITFNETSANWSNVLWNISRETDPDRRANALVGIFFVLPSAPNDYYLCTSWAASNSGNTSSASWNGIGGKFNIYPSFTSRGVNSATVTQITAKFPPALFNLGHPIVTYSNKNENSYSTLWDLLHNSQTINPGHGYFSFNVARAALVILCLHDLTSPLWDGLGKNLRISQRVINLYKTKRALGDVFMDKGFDGSCDWNNANDQRIQAMFRKIFFDGQGYVGVPYVVPS